MPTEEERARFESLVRQYGRLVAAVVARVGGRATAHVREDVEQEVLLALWKALGEQGPEHPSSYIYRAAVRETVRAVRREIARAAEPLGSDGPELAAGSGPHDSLEAREKADQIEACLGALALERERAVRAHLSGFTVAEVMAMYGWPYEKARNLVARGMADLRRCLQAKGVGAGESR